MVSTARLHRLEREASRIGVESSEAYLLRLDRQTPGQWARTFEDWFQQDHYPPPFGELLAQLREAGQEGAEGLVDQMLQIVAARADALNATSEK